MRKFGLGLFVVLLIMCSCNPGNSGDSLELKSPDGKNILSFSLSGKGEPQYSLKKDNKALIEKSAMGFLFRKGDEFSSNFEIVKSGQITSNTSWKPVVGQYKEIKNHYNQLNVELKEKSGKKRKLNIIFRLFNDGLGFRYL